MKKANKRVTNQLNNLIEQVRLFQNNLLNMYGDFTTNPKRIIFTFKPLDPYMPNGIGGFMAMIQIAGDGIINIDWGDGTRIKKHILSPFNSKEDWSEWEEDDWREKKDLDWDSDIAPLKHGYQHGYDWNFVFGNEPVCINVIITYENITHLSCSHNQMISLDVSQNTNLICLYCGENQLTSLDISKNTELTNLDCSNNQLTILDTNHNTALTTLSCGYNYLSKIDVSKNIELTALYFSNNQIIAFALTFNN